MSLHRFHLFRHYHKPIHTSVSGVDLIAQKYPDSVIAEQFRTLRTNLAFSSVHTLLITSDSPGEGKSTVAANLATVWANEDKRVCIVDCDMRRPTVALTFGLNNKLGLSTFLSHQSKALIQQTKINNLYAITSGPIPPDPSELISSSLMNKLIQLLKSKYDIVILDTPPVNSISDTSILAPEVDGVVLVVPQNIAQKTDVQNAVTQLKKAHAHILGTVMNRVTKRMSSNYYYYYYYYY